MGYDTPEKVSFRKSIREQLVVELHTRLRARLGDRVKIESLDTCSRIIVDGVAVPVAMPSWGDWHVAIEVGWSPSRSPRSKKDGSFHHWDQVIDSIVQFAEGTIHAEKAQAEQQQQRAGTVAWLHGMGLNESKSSWEKGPNFEWQVDQHGAINVKLRILPGNLEQFKKLLDAFPAK